MTSVSKQRLDKKAEEVRVLDTATQDLLATVKNKNNKAIKWFVISWTLLFALGVFGIFKQNQIANANKTHIDCIVKLLATPLPAGSKSRVLTNPSTTCNIRFTQ